MRERIIRRFVSLAVVIRGVFFLPCLRGRARLRAFEPPSVGVDRGESVE